MVRIVTLHGVFQVERSLWTHLLERTPVGAAGQAPEGEPTVLATAMFSLVSRDCGAVRGGTLNRRLLSHLPGMTVDDTTHRTLYLSPTVPVPPGPDH